MPTHAAEPLLARTLPLAHGFFTRRGGVSGGPYASLNCSLGGGDAPEAVAANRARAALAVGAQPEHLLGLHQVHGAAVVVADAAWQAGAGPRADAMVTNRPGLALGVVTADCAPVLLADPEAGVVGAAHAGWRGAVAGVLEATVEAMLGLGASRPRIAAAIGPCIRQASYEVAADLRDAVLAGHPEDAAFFAAGERPARWQFDLPGYCAARLGAAGIASVEDLRLDTLTDEPRFFSHRRRTRAGGGPIGHQVSVIAVLPAAARLGPPAA